jgi:uncharacterized protein (DUF2141 family)
MKRNWFTHIALPALAALPIAAWAADLDLKIDNVKEPLGELRVGVFGSEGDYRKTAVKEVKAPATGGSVSIRIPGLGAGEYAITIFHDRNANQKLDSNMLGMPKEPYGFSGSGANLTGPATWEQAKFNIATDGGSVTVRLSD